MNTKEALKMLRAEYSERIMAKYNGSDPKTLELASILVDSLSATIESLDEE